MPVNLTLFGLLSKKKYSDAVNNLSFPKTKEELKQRLKEADEKPPIVITFDEYATYQEKTLFECPIGRDPRDCDGKPCPTRPDNPHEDYFDECACARRSRSRLRQVLNGKIVVSNGNGGWEIPV